MARDEHARDRGGRHDRGGRRGGGCLAVDGLARRERLDRGEPGGARGRQARDRRAATTCPTAPRARSRAGRRTRSRSSCPRTPPGSSATRSSRRSSRASTHGSAAPTTCSICSSRATTPATRRPSYVRSGSRRRRDHRLAPHERHLHRPDREPRAGRLRRPARRASASATTTSTSTTCAAARDATTYLIERGHHRIATITGPLTMPAGIDRLQGYRDALAAPACPRAPSRTATSPPTAVPAAMRRILEQRRAARRDLRRERPHGARCARGARAGGDPGARGHRDHGLRRLAGRDIRPPAADDDASAVLRPGRADGEVLLDLLAGRHPRHVTILETELVVRDSV